MRNYDPFRELESLRREMDRAFRGVADALGLRTAAESAGNVLRRATRPYPRVNVSQDAENVYVEAMAPGLEPNSVEITVLRDQLTLSGERVPTGTAVDRDAYHRSERSVGRFTRTLTLPSEVDDEKVTADYENGILYLTLQKVERARPRKINVHVA